MIERRGKIIYPLSLFHLPSQFHITTEHHFDPFQSTQHLFTYTTHATHWIRNRFIVSASIQTKTQWKCEKWTVTNLVNQFDAFAVCLVCNCPFYLFVCVLWLWIPFGKFFATDSNPFFSCFFFLCRHSYLLQINLSNDRIPKTKVKKRTIFLFWKLKWELKRKMTITKLIVLFVDSIYRIEIAQAIIGKWYIHWHTQQSCKHSKFAAIHRVHAMFEFFSMDGARMCKMPYNKCHKLDEKKREEK